VSEITCGLPVASSVIEIVPLTLPETLGVKVTLMVQFAPTARAVPQLFVSEKLALATINEIVKVAVPEFVSVMGRGGLFAPTTCGPKFNAVIESEALGDEDETLDWFPTEAPPQP
jgi:hypothetical protein